MQLAKLLILLGLITAAIGVVWLIAGKWIPLGRLPGDIAIEKENFRFYFPITTCLLLSLAVWVILRLIRWFTH